MSRDVFSGVRRMLFGCPCGCGKSRWWYWKNRWQRGPGRGRWVVEESAPNNPWKIYTTGFWTRRGAERCAADPFYAATDTRVLRTKEMDRK